MKRVATFEEAIEGWLNRREGRDKKLQTEKLKKDAIENKEITEESEIKNQSELDIF